MRKNKVSGFQVSGLKRTALSQNSSQNSSQSSFSAKPKERFRHGDLCLFCIRCIIISLAAALVWLVLDTYGFYTAESIAAVAAFLVIFAGVFAIRKADEWERAVILRFGKFKTVKGPGLYFVIPLIDRAAKTIDLRIRVTDFSAQETLTLDSVTVTVDALCFWLVWDPEKAALEVQDYEEAVVLSSKTALRNAVSSHDLTTFLERGDIIEKRIQSDVDKRTTDWGITIQHIEITDIQIPQILQDSLSRLAQAEREKKGRILLAEAEIEIASKLSEAMRIYGKNAGSLKLKSLSILNEGFKAGNSMILVPHELAEELKGNDFFGLEALSEIRKSKRDGDASAAPL